MSHVGVGANRQVLVDDGTRRLWLPGANFLAFGAFHLNNQVSGHLNPGSRDSGQSAAGTPNGYPVLGPLMITDLAVECRTLTPPVVEITWTVQLDGVNTALSVVQTVADVGVEVSGSIAVGAGLHRIGIASAAALDLTVRRYAAYVRVEAVP